MRFEFQVVNILGCRDAGVTLDKITAICGNNFQGKSSFFRAVSGLMTGEPMIFPKMAQKDAGLLITDGAKLGMVEVSAIADDTGEVCETSIGYPDLKKKSSGGNPPSASRIAMGLTSLVDMPDKERYSYCTELLGIVPSFEDFAAAIKEANLSPENITILWQKIESYGWDSVYKDTNGKGSELKGAWQQVTGESKWGSVKAENWLPESWASDLIHAKKKTLESDVAQAEEWVVAAAKEDAVITAERERLDKFIDQHISFRAELKEAQNEYGKLDTLHSKGILELKKYSGAVPNAMKCPHCKEQFILTDNGPVAYTAAAAKKATDDKKMYDSIVLANEQLSKEKETARHNISELTATCKQLDQAVARLAELGKEQGNPKNEQAEADAKAKLATAKERLSAFNTKLEADRLHQNITRNAILINALSPDGVRHTALSRALTEANDLLREISTVSGWPQITLTEDLEVEYGTRRFVMCSESEQFRARVMLQFMVATLEETPFIMIDRVDVLDTTGRNQLFKLALKSGIPTLVFMTILGDSSLSPALSKAGGETYWMAEGRTKKI